MKESNKFVKGKKREKLTASLQNKRKEEQCFVKQIIMIGYNLYQNHAITKDVKNRLYSMSDA